MTIPLDRHFDDPPTDAEIEDLVPNNWSDGEDDEDAVDPLAPPPAVDFSDLDDILEEATREQAEEQRLRAARKRLAKIGSSLHPEALSERAQLLEDIRRLEEGRTWHTVETVALFYTQECMTCGSHHSFFMGWFHGQKHVSDPNSRRLLVGKPIERLPERRENHDHGKVDICHNCVEAQFAIDVATGEAAEAP